MRRGMEKERKGLFGRMLHFWREKISMSDGDGIGFWNGKETMENHFAELGAVAALSQAETKKIFWEMAEKVPAKESNENVAMQSADIQREKRLFLQEKEKEPLAEKHQSSILRMSEMRLGEDSKTVFGKVFQQEIEFGERRKIIPVAEESAEQPKIVSKEIPEVPKMEKVKAEEKQTLSEMDIEKLMRQMTRKLWEEREGCGRRLR